jgi:hypothetical protein
MCVAYNYVNQLIYTGGHDGSLIAWNFETGYIKFYLHELDPTCMSKSGNYILESKSVDCVRYLFLTVIDLDDVCPSIGCFSFG